MSNPFKTIAFPTDLTILDVGAVGLIHSILSTGVSELHVFHVLSLFDEIPMGYPIPPEYYKEVDLAAAKSVEEIASQLALKGVNITIGIYRGRPDQTILEVSAAKNADAILIFSHGKGIFGRILMGSTSTSVLHHAPIPVILLKPDAINRDLMQHLDKSNSPPNIYPSRSISGEAGPNS
ncbi:MAG: universal stress protein [Leptospirales bacterium]